MYRTHTGGLRETHPFLEGVYKQLFDPCSFCLCQVEQVHAKVTEAATELLTGAASIAVAESNNRVMEEYQGEAERIKEELQRCLERFTCFCL